jgi:hypothetical protein
VIAIPLYPKSDILPNNQDCLPAIHFEKPSLDYLLSYYIRETSAYIKYGYLVFDNTFTDAARWLQFGRGDLAAIWIKKFICPVNPSSKRREYRVGDMYEYSFKFFMDSAPLEIEKWVTLKGLAIRVKEILGTLPGIEVHQWNGHTAYTGFYLNAGYYYEGLNRKVYESRWKAHEEKMNLSYRDRQMNKAPTLLPGNTMSY